MFSVLSNPHVCSRLCHTGWFFSQGFYDCLMPNASYSLVLSHLILLSSLNRYDYLVQIVTSKTQLQETEALLN